MWFTIVMAALGATTGLVDSISGDTEKWHSIEDQLNYIEELYGLEKKKVKEEYAAEKETAEKNAAIAKKQADISDLKMDVTEALTSENFNATIDNLYLSQLEDNMTWNAQQRAIGQGEGAGLAQLAGSGIRAGSSLSQAVEIEAAANEAQLQFSQDAKRRSDENNLGVMLSNLAGAKVDIYGNRVSADVTRQEATDLYNSYQVGGHNYNLYQNKLDTLKSQYDYNKDTLEKEQKKHVGLNAFWNGVRSFFTMGAAGAQTGYNLQKIGTELGGYGSKVNSKISANTVRDITPKVIGMR